jgi:uncharacterized protein YaiL (DUF2058 family)
MANSLQEQLLKAGLATEASLQKANTEKKKHTNNKKPKKLKPSGKHSAKQTNEPNLADLYRQRNNLERKEREEEIRKKQEAARLKKQNRKKLRDLIGKHTQNVENAEVRYNFVVGSTVKYVFVTEEQQEQLSNGKLAITFMDGKRCLIPPELKDEILALDAEKIIVVAAPDD